MAYETTLPPVTYDLSDMTDADVGDLLSQIHITDGAGAGADLDAAASELFEVKVSVSEVKDGVWLVTIPMPAPREGELEAVVVSGSTRLPNPIWRPKRVGAFRSLCRRIAHVPQPALATQAVVLDLGRW